MRIACVSDSYLSTTSRKAESPSYQEDNEGLRELIHQETSRAHTTILRWMKDHGPWNAVVHLGNMVSGYQGEGCWEGSVASLMQDCKDELRTLAPYTFFSAGARCLGDSHTHWRSVKTWKQTFQSFSWVHGGSHIACLGISSPLVAYNGGTRSIIQEKREQESFIRWMLTVHAGTPLVLFTHNPFELASFEEVLSPFLPMIQGVVCGEFHRPESELLLRGAARLPTFFLPRHLRNSFLRELLKKTIVCPSVAPLWWRGYGVLELSLSSEDGVRRIHHRVSRHTESVQIPTGSFTHWMRRWRQVKF